MDTQKMFEKFYPNEYMDSTYSIDFKAYYDRGYRGILFDVDNTWCLTMHLQMTGQSVFSGN